MVGLLAFKRLICTLDALIHLFGSINVAHEYKESDFGSFDVPLQKIVILATLATFLAFTALKLGNTRNNNKLTPNGPKNMKKSLIFLILTHRPLQWPL